MFYRILFIFIFPVCVQAKTLLILGDSLSSAYGMSLNEGWVSLLQQRIIDQNLDYNVINASIGGETTFGARARLEELLQEYAPHLVIVELGGNDGLRGLALDDIERNLLYITSTIKATGSKVLLVSMRLPPNYGSVYDEHFSAIYSSVARDANVPLARFILDGIGDNAGLMQADGIHPLPAAQPMMLDNIWDDLSKLLK